MPYTIAAMSSVLTLCHQHCCVCAVEWLGADLGDACRWGTCRLTLPVLPAGAYHLALLPLDTAHSEQQQQVPKQQEAEAVGTTTSTQAGVSAVARSRRVSCAPLLLQPLLVLPLAAAEELEQLWQRRVNQGVASAAAAWSTCMAGVVQDLAAALACTERGIRGTAHVRSVSAAAADGGTGAAGGRGRPVSSVTHLQALLEPLLQYLVANHMGACIDMLLQRLSTCHVNGTLVSSPMMETPLQQHGPVRTSGGGNGSSPAGSSKHAAAGGTLAAGNSTEIVGSSGNSSTRVGGPSGGRDSSQVHGGRSSSTGSGGGGSSSTLGGNGKCTRSVPVSGSSSSSCNGGAAGGVPTRKQLMAYAQQEAEAGWVTRFKQLFQGFRSQALEQAYLRHMSQHGSWADSTSLCVPLLPLATGQGSVGLLPLVMSLGWRAGLLACGQGLLRFTVLAMVPWVGASALRPWLVVEAR